MNVAGGVIYSISFFGSDKTYVGSTANSPVRRLSTHLHRLKRGDHHSIGLQRAAQKYGLLNLCFSILEAVPDKSKLIEAEQRWIDQTRGKHLNASLTAGSRLGMKMPDSAKAAISESLKGNSRRSGKPHDPEIKQKISVGLCRAYSGGRRKAKFCEKTLSRNNDKVSAEGKARALIWLEHWRDGKSVEQIATETGFDKSTVRRSLKRYFGISHRREA